MNKLINILVRGLIYRTIYRHPIGCIIFVALMYFTTKHSTEIASVIDTISAFI